MDRYLCQPRLTIKGADHRKGTRRANTTLLLTPLRAGLTPRSVLEKFGTVQMLDVHLPTTDERTVIPSRYTHPEVDVQLLLQRLKLELPAQPPPKITRPKPSGYTGSVVKT